MTLYELDAEILAFIDSLDEQGLSDLKVAELDKLAMDRRAKFIGITKAVLNAKAMSESLQMEMDVLQRKKTAQDNLAKRLKAYMQASMEQMGETKLVTGWVHDLAVRGNGGLQALSVNVVPDELPYWAKKIVVTADTDAIRERYKKDGTLPDGVELQPRGKHLSII
jgi:Siphovirus Gp157